MRNRETDGMRNLTVGFLLLEALATILWWLMLWLFPSSRALFLPPRVPQIVLFSFFLPDVLIFISAPLIAAFGLWRGKSWAKSVFFVHCGGATYAALFTLAICVSGGGGFLGAVSMILCALVLWFLAWRLNRAGN